MDGFLNLILEVWNQDFLGISIGNVVISLIIIVISLILRAVIISRVFKFLENLAKETETEADDILLETLERPIGNVPLALGLYLIIELLPLSGIADVFLTNTVKALISDGRVKSVCLHFWESVISDGPLLPPRRRVVARRKWRFIGAPSPGSTRSAPAPGSTRQCTARR